MSPDDGKKYLKLCVHLSARLHSDFSYFMRMPVGMLADTVKEVSRLGRQK